ncbi:sensor histidine kinase [Flavobacterium daejeonense]|uniref:sensor histidine kinase n=1 Tax=Flavobacterium daejeonense TaxID=350893 RepID=UPI00068E3C0C|nr:HAMP domain-containing sensor histidine kinase [Flavobacterium daejeonense]
MKNETQLSNSPTISEQIALAAHDFRNIINGIYGLNQLLSEKLNRDADPEIQEYLKLIATQCELGTELTSGLILPYQQSWFNLNELLTELQQTHQHRANSKNITLTVSFSNKDIYLRTDRTKLIRVLNNLFDNALKFTPRKGLITTKLTQQDNKALISIIDTGIGIPKSFHSTLFDKQPQTERTGTENEVSTGLGLYISKKLTEELNGQLWFESTENNGTTFHLSIDKTNKL